MSIFEQFGIKEVADVTIYAIDLNKYGDEVYVPIMYLDTLKVSTLEQTASQTSARGGLGNPELISWDFGKEISISLQDALYTPASQSLMWGGEYGIKKPQLYGVWNPFVYPVDSSGRQLYSKKVEVETYMYKQTSQGWTFYYVDIENSTMYQYLATNIAGRKIIGVKPGKGNVSDEAFDGWLITIAGETEPTMFGWVVVSDDVVEINFKYISQESPVVSTEMTETTYNPLSFVCPCDGEKKYFFIWPQEGHYLYNRDGEGYTDQMVLTEYNCPSENPIYEAEEISRSVGKYTIAANGLDDEYTWTNGERPEMAVLDIDNFGTFTYHAYEFVSNEQEPNICYYHDIDLCDESLIKCTDETVDAYGYVWEDTSIAISSLEKTQETYYVDSADIRYRVRNDTGLREIALEYHSDNDNNYQAKIDIYKTITQTYLDDNGFEQVYKTQILVGSFYIIDDWNQGQNSPSEFTYQINNGIQNVDMLEKIEKIQADKTFAIDADKNLRCSNYRFDTAYNNTVLNVYLDPNTMAPFEPNSRSYITQDGVELEGNFTIIRQGTFYYKWSREISDGYSSLGRQIIVNATSFPGTYRIVGETYARSRKDGQDQHYQFDIPLCKLAADTNITLEAAGDPTTFTMNFKVLRKDDGTMVKLTQYNGPISRFAEDEKPSWNEGETRTVFGSYRADLVNTQFVVVNPSNNTVQFSDSEEDAPLDGTGAGVIQKAKRNYIADIVEDGTPIKYGTTVNIPTQKLKAGAEERFAADIDKLVVKKVDTYDIYRETHKETRAGEIVPGSSVWNKVATRSADTYLNDSEYTFNDLTNVDEQR